MDEIENKETVASTHKIGIYLWIWGLLFVLSFFSGIVDLTTIYRTIPLIIILPIGVYIGDKFFVKSKEETYSIFVFYFL